MKFSNRRKKRKKERTMEVNRKSDELFWCWVERKEIKRKGANEGGVEKERKRWRKEKLARSRMRRRRRRRRRVCLVGYWKFKVRKRVGWMWRKKNYRWKRQKESWQGKRSEASNKRNKNDWKKRQCLQCLSALLQRNLVVIEGEYMRVSRESFYKWCLRHAGLGVISSVYWRSPGSSAVGNHCNSMFNLKHSSFSKHCLVHEEEK